jgi:dTDP-4-dehydrorhamnose 3,5-epimerase
MVLGQFHFIKGPMEGLWIIEPRPHTDIRGSFMEVYHYREFKQAGIPTQFVQDNESVSHKGVLRGLHFQGRFPQGKLVRVSQGKIFDVAVDIRPDSNTFGQWFGLELNSVNKRMLFIPPCFAHGFLAMSEPACVVYKCTDYYHSKDQSGILWSDPDLGIDWPDIGMGEYILSEKDKQLPYFKDIKKGIWGNRMQI